MFVTKKTVFHSGPNTFPNQVNSQPSNPKMFKAPNSEGQEEVPRDALTSQNLEKYNSETDISTVDGGSCLMMQQMESNRISQAAKSLGFAWPIVGHSDANSGSRYKSPMERFLAEEDQARDGRSFSKDTDEGGQK